MFNKKCTKLVAAMGITLSAGVAQAAYRISLLTVVLKPVISTGWAQFPGC